MHSAQAPMIHAMLVKQLFVFAEIVEGGVGAMQCEAKFFRRHIGAPQSERHLIHRSRYRKVVVKSIANQAHDRPTLLT